MKTLLLLQLWWSLSRLRERDRWTRQQLEAHQANALRELRAFAAARSPFYRRFHEGLADRPLRELPVLTKSLLMEHYDEVATDRALHLKDLETHLSSVRGDQRFLGRYWVNATSGSTGRRGIFPFDRSEWLQILTSFARAHEFGGAKVSLSHRMRMASVASTAPWHISARVAATFESGWMPARRLDAGEPLDRLVARLNEWRPEMLVAYASMAQILAREQLAGRLRISPHLVFTSSEVLTEGMRQTIEQAWGRHLFNQYGATGPATWPPNASTTAACTSSRTP